MTSTKGIDTSNNQNTTRIQIDAGNKDKAVLADKAIANSFDHRFYIQLDFELLESHMPVYQSALGDRLEYEPDSDAMHVAAQQQQQLDDQRVREYRDRLTAAVAGGSARKYDITVLGKPLTVNQVEELSD